MKGGASTRQALVDADAAGCCRPTAHSMVVDFLDRSAFRLKAIPSASEIVM
jgi:hypothetical protein